MGPMQQQAAIEELLVRVTTLETLVKELAKKAAASPLKKFKSSKDNNKK